MQHVVDKLNNSRWINATRKEDKERKVMITVCYEIVERAGTVSALL